MRRPFPALLALCAAATLGAQSVAAFRERPGEAPCPSRGGPRQLVPDCRDRHSLHPRATHDNGATLRRPFSTPDPIARSVPLLAALLFSFAGCTAVKPIVCAFTYPIDNIRERLNAPDGPDAHEDLPPVLVLVAAPVVVPMRFLSEAAIGCVGGLFSGFASDLNVITGNCSSVARNLSRPFRTNARKPE